MDSQEEEALLWLERCFPQLLDLLLQPACDVVSDLPAGTRLNAEILVRALGVNRRNGRAIQGETLVWITPPPPLLARYCDAK